MTIQRKKEFDKQMEELKIGLLRYFEDCKPKTSKKTTVKNNNGNNRNIDQRPNTNNQNKDVLARRKCKQTAVNFDNLLYVCSVEMK